MPAQAGYFDTLKSVAGKVFTYLASITLTGTDGKTITVTQDTSLDEAVAMSSKAPKASPTFTGTATAPIMQTVTGNTGSIATATPTSILQTVAQSVYLLAAFIYQGATPYHATATVINDDNTPALLNYAHGANITLQVSGTQITVTQNSGGNSTVQYRWLRIA